MVSHYFSQKVGYRKYCFMATPSSKPTKPKHRKRGSRRMGRILLFLLFIALLAAAAAGTLFLPHLGLQEASILKGILVISALWNTVLLIAVAYRQEWARIILIGFLLFCAVALVAVYPELVGQNTILRTPKMIGILFFMGITQVISAVVLIFSTNVRWLMRNSID